MTLTAHEFIRRFLLHVLPDGFHRIRHYGLLAPRRCADTIERCRKLVTHATPAKTDQPDDSKTPTEQPDKHDGLQLARRGRGLLWFDRLPAGYETAAILPMVLIGSVPAFPGD